MAAIRTMAALVALAAAQGAADYEVKLERPHAVGDRHRFEAEASDQKVQTMTIDGKPQPPTTDKLSVKAEYVQIVDEVDARGRATKERLVFDKLIATTGDKREARLAPGTIIEGSFDGTETLFTRQDGEILDTLVLQCLELFHKLDRGEVGHDRIFATAGRHKPGDTWPIDSQATMLRFREGEIEVQAEDIEGTVTLGKLGKHAGEPCLDLEARLIVKKMKPPGQGIPLGLVVEQATADAELEVLLPVDPSRQPPRIVETMRSTGRISGTRGGKPVVILVEGTRVRRIEVTPAGS